MSLSALIFTFVVSGTIAYLQPVICYRLTAPCGKHYLLFALRGLTARREASRLYDIICGSGRSWTWLMHLARSVFYVLYLYTTPNGDLYATLPFAGLSRLLILLPPPGYFLPAFTLYGLGLFTTNTHWIASSYVCIWPAWVWNESNICRICGSVSTWLFENENRTANTYPILLSIFVTIVTYGTLP